MRKTRGTRPLRNLALNGNELHVPDNGRHTHVTAVQKSSAVDHIFNCSLENSFTSIPCAKNYKLQMIQMEVLAMSYNNKRPKTTSSAIQTTFGNREKLKTVAAGWPSELHGHSRNLTGSHLVREEEVALLQFGELLLELRFTRNPLPQLLLIPARRAMVRKRCLSLPRQARGCESQRSSRLTIAALLAAIISAAVSP
jgi:hypothetical protein